MQLGSIVGNAAATVKHESLSGWRLLVVQPLTESGEADGQPLLAIDNLGAASGDTVILSNDGAGAREMIGSDNSPARWFVMGIRDGGEE